MNEIKTQFTTREGVYKLLSHSEYSRPNRVPFNSQGSNPVRVSFVNVNDQSGNGDRLCFNVGRELYFYIYKGVRKVPRGRGCCGVGACARSCAPGEGAQARGTRCVRRGCARAAGPLPPGAPGAGPCRCAGPGRPRPSPDRSLLLVPRECSRPRSGFFPWARRQLRCWTWAEAAMSA